jgi:glycosyltransferase involved in cell wall biosynthesis
MIIDVIIRTIADRHRGQTILGVIESIVSQKGVHARPLIIVNGPRVDAEVVAKLRGIPEVRLLEIEGGLVESTYEGVKAVETEYFAFIDDDDEYLPNAFAAMAAAMNQAPSVDVVVANGWLIGADGVKIPVIPDVDRTAADPVAALRDGTWLHSSGALFRTRSFSPMWFANAPFGVEWTWFAYKAAIEKRLRFIDAMAYVYNDTPSSVSKHERAILAIDDGLTRVRKLPLPPSEHSHLRHKHARTLHGISMWYLQRNRFGEAWRYHARSVLETGGWGYVPYSRHILFGWLGSRIRPVIP